MPATTYLHMSFPVTLLTLLILFVLATVPFALSQASWNRSSTVSWATGCDFYNADNDDIGSARVASPQCPIACRARQGCTHFAWTKYEGGTCWFKNDTSITEGSVMPSNKPGAVCGIIRSPAIVLQAMSRPTASWRPFTRSGKNIDRTRWFSEEGNGYSGRVTAPIAGLVCNGRYCDNKRLVTVRDGPSTRIIANSAHWTRWISEESPSWANCPRDMLVNEMQCRGSRCDNIRLQCGRLESRYRVNTGQIRQVNWFSEEQGERLCPDGYYFWGMACRGRYCDDLKLNCARVEYLPLPTFSPWRSFTSNGNRVVRSRWFTDGEYGGYSFRMVGPVAGIACYGRYCDDMQLITVQRDDDIAVVYANHFTHWFTDGNPSSASCPRDMVVNEIQCRGRYCDDMRLQCGRLAKGYRVDNRDRRYVSWFSEEQGEGFCPDGYYVWAIHCRGSYCDDIHLTCVRVDYDPTVPGEMEGFRHLMPDGIYGRTWSNDGSPKPWVVWASRSWMAKLPDGTQINRISIPGTHDSAARFGGVFCETNSWTLEKQLQAGIRYFDIRCRRMGTFFAIHHGACFQNIMFGDVVNQVAAFLRSHPRETVLMRVKEEHTPGTGSQSFTYIWNSYMRRYGSLFAKNVNGRIPTLGELRGRILVLRDNSGIDSSYGIAFDSPDTDVQDYFKIKGLIRAISTSSGSISTGVKKVHIRTFLQKAKTSSKLVMNHLSAVGGGARIVKYTPKSVAKQMNLFAYFQIGRYTGRVVTGIVIMDFPSEKLVYRILRTNF